MKKSEKIAKFTIEIAKDEKYIKANNIYISGLENQLLKAKNGKGIDNGKGGKANEKRQKLIMDNVSGRLISLPNAIDTRKKVNGSLFNIECKTGSGELKQFEHYNFSDDEISDTVFLAQCLGWDKPHNVMCYCAEYPTDVSDNDFMSMTYVIPTTILFDIVASGKKKLVRVTPSRPNVIRFCSDFKIYGYKIIEQYNLPTLAEWLSK